MNDIEPEEDDYISFTPKKFTSFDFEDELFLSRKTTNSFDSYFDSKQSTNIKGENPDSNDYSYPIDSYN